jgi:integrase
VAHYLDPARRPARVARWSERHRDEQVRYCRRFVLPVLAAVPCRRMTRLHLQAVLDQAPTASVAEHLRRCLTALVAAGLEEGHLLARQDVLRGVRWRGGEAEAPEAPGLAITEAEIPPTAAVHALARAAAERSGVWWRELEVLLVAYSGLRWGEHVALSADRVDLGRRRITLDRQVIETRSALKLSLPKGRRRRVTMLPARTPGGVDLAALVDRRLGELEADALVFPAPRGGWARRSNYGRNTWDPAAAAAGWPRRADGRWAWTFHSLRHVFATWALAQPGLGIEDVSRLLGHSSTRVTQEVYVHVYDDVYQRFYEATE